MRKETITRSPFSSQGRRSPGEGTGTKVKFIGPATCAHLEVNGQVPFVPLSHQEENYHQFWEPGRNAETICTKENVAAFQEGGSPSGTQCLWTVYFTWDESKHLKCTHSQSQK